MPTTKKLGLRLFIEGIEIPIVSINTSATKMRAAQAHIVIPASDKVHNLLPRSVVHVFYYDASRAPRNASGESMAGDGELDGSRPDLKSDPTNPYRWHLMFTGEAMGYSYNKRASARHITLIVADFTNYWDTARIYYGSGGITNRSFQQAVFMGAAKVTRGKETVKNTFDLMRIINTRPSTVPTLQGLLGGCVHLLESITGVYDKKAARRFRGISDFMCQAELRLNLTKMIGVSPRDLSSHYFTNNSDFKRYMVQLSRSIQNTATYGQLLRILLDRTFHIYTPVLCPPFIKEGAKAKFKKLVPIKGKQNSHAKGIDRTLEDMAKAMEDALDHRFKEVETRITNDVFTDRSTDDRFASVSGGPQNSTPDVAGQRKWRNEREPTIARPEAVTALATQIGSLTTTPGFSQSQRRALLQKSETISKLASVFKDKLMRENDIKGETHNVKFPGHTKEAFDEAYRLLEAAKIKSNNLQYKTVDGEITLTNRLNATLFCPLIWMCPPPKCNVIFPDMYTSIDFNRHWDSEVSRLWLYGIRRDGSQNFSQSYFAPNVDIVNGQLSRQDVTKAALHATSFMLPHEKFMGIVPSIQGIGNAAELKKINKEVTKKEDNKSGDFLSFNKSNPALSRAAHALFFKERFQSRTAMVQGPFNPSIVCGLPALILDPVIVSSEASTDETGTVKGTHYLGLVDTVSHTIGQSGATTIIALSFCRAHNEGLNVFGESKDAKVVVHKEQKIGRKRVASADKPYLAEVYGFSVKTVVVTEGNKKITKYRVVPSIGMLGIQSKTGKHVTAGLALQNAAIDATIVSGGTVDVSGASGLPISGLPRSELFKNAYTVEPSKSDDVLTVDNPSAKVPTSVITNEMTMSGYHYLPPPSWMKHGKRTVIAAIEVDAYLASQARPTVKKYDFEFSFEQIARPPWLSEIYLNGNIGEQFYMPLLGCESMVDSLLIGGSRPDVEISTGNSAAISPEVVQILKATAQGQSKLKLKTAELLINEIKNDPDITDKEHVVIERADGTTISVSINVIAGAPIQVMTEELATAYMELVKADIDTATFIDTYTDRKFATLVDMFGLGYKEGSFSSEGDDRGIVGTYSVKVDQEFDPTGEYTSERPDALDGFHSSAFGQVEDLALLRHEDLVQGPSKQIRPIDPSVDPRQDRYDRVLDYADSLNLRGVRG